MSWKLEYGRLDKKDKKHKRRQQKSKQHKSSKVNHTQRCIYNLFPIFYIVNIVLKVYPSIICIYTYIHALLLFYFYHFLFITLNLIILYFYFLWQSSTTDFTSKNGAGSPWGNQIQPASTSDGSWWKLRFGSWSWAWRGTGFANWDFRDTGFLSNGSSAAVFREPMFEIFEGGDWICNNCTRHFRNLNQSVYR